MNTEDFINDLKNDLIEEMEKQLKLKEQEIQELKQKEIADLLNIKLSLVKYRVSKAKELLAKQLEVEKL